MVLEEGTISAIGTHDELLERSTTYQDMVAVPTARPEAPLAPE